MVLSGESSSNSRSRTARIWGWLLVGTGSVVLPGFLFATFISKLLPPSNYPLIAAIQSDRADKGGKTKVKGESVDEVKKKMAHKGNTCWYYCYLVPLTLPVLVVAVYFHWLSMKLFKHA